MNANPRLVACASRCQLLTGAKEGSQYSCPCLWSGCYLNRRQREELNDNLTVHGWHVVDHLGRRIEGDLVTYLDPFTALVEGNIVEQWVTIIDGQSVTLLNREDFDDNVNPSAKCIFFSAPSYDVARIIHDANAGWIEDLPAVALGLCETLGIKVCAEEADSE